MEEKIRQANVEELEVIMGSCRLFQAEYHERINGVTRNRPRQVQPVIVTPSTDEPTAYAVIHKSQTYDLWAELDKLREIDVQDFMAPGDAEPNQATALHLDPTIED